MATIKNITQQGSKLIITQGNGSQRVYEKVASYSYMDESGRREISRSRFDSDGGILLITFNDGTTTKLLNARKSNPDAFSAGMAGGEILGNILGKILSTKIGKIIALVVVVFFIIVAIQN
ncbi:hypothetical protein CQA49_03245 [Helicobacter sp. MIT 00-7814]|uniref:hypothetical protein n=1 Tax=unclassified Helicobacter TaxID=2593540 RepID=UPI000E1F2670|nr:MULTISPECIES: hypothetical protein [unclassified Helicobacter]RDU55492.1 hypothetical protein CQA37_03665 [Helicobacter sp. MIT 99-10781]RDU55581.1 hypothetical protein CQA49_03245 [Helicobacter sp. MIT 00-7814]